MPLAERVDSGRRFVDVTTLGGLRYAEQRLSYSGHCRNDHNRRASHPFGKDFGRASACGPILTGSAAEFHDNHRFWFLIPGLSSVEPNSVRAIGNIRIVRSATGFIPCEPPSRSGLMRKAANSLRLTGCCPL